MRKLSLILALILIASVLGCVQQGIAFAASETVYTGVLEDLQKDETFDVSKYPSKDTLSEKDKVMDVIQIAESDDGELFLYVYQPLSAKFTATEARISLTIDDELAPDDYELTLLNRNGTLEKYKVNGVQVGTYSTRHYFILQLARPWNVQLDNGNITDTVAYPIEKLFTVEAINSEITYTETHSDCIEIESKYVGNLRYYNGGTWGQENYLSMHYVAFSTNVSIDTIYEVDLAYSVIDYSMVIDVDYLTWSDAHRNNPMFTGGSLSPRQGKKTLRSQQYNSYKNAWDYLLNKSHSWDQIESKDKFVAGENLDKSVVEELQDKQWVCRFLTTDITRKNMGLAGHVYSFSEVSEVSLLRLNFLSNGIVYNLGVIDNKQTGGSVVNPDNPADDNSVDGAISRLEKLWDDISGFFSNLGVRLKNAWNWIAEHWWVIPVVIIGLGVVIALIVAFVKYGFVIVIKAIGKVLWWVVKYIGLAIWWFIKYLGIGLFYIVTSPYWIIRVIVLAAKRNKSK